ncbi:hypothetical protein AVEN_5461-1 [Araneus ventricosus]|uniref:Uncharacterized protein n=1 Tax=Araneus ventricosus TaxID=182803 RepID=A0A4Y2DZS3_ARAVE|nr:hypothetical protein AVEN_5461-1 [Araneus ventricosus]
MDLVILNRGQRTRKTPELAPLSSNFAPHRPLPPVIKPSTRLGVPGRSAPHQRADSRGEGVFTFGLDEKPEAVFYPELSHILTQYGALGASL